MGGDVSTHLGAAVDGVLPDFVRAEKLENARLEVEKLAVSRPIGANGGEFQQTEHVADDREAQRVVGNLRQRAPPHELRSEARRGAAPE